MGFRRPYSRTACSTPSAFSPPAAPIAALPTSTSVLPARKSVARLAVRKTRAVVASPDPTRGKPICGARPVPSTGAATCPWRKASTSTSRPEIAGPAGSRGAVRGDTDRRQAGLALHEQHLLIEAFHRNRQQGPEVLSKQRQAIF